MLKKWLKTLKPTPRLSVSRWADEFRMLPSESPEPGRYKSARVPYFVKVMDAFTQPEIKKVVVKSSSQCGKSEVLLNVVGRYAQLDPCSIMILQPTLETAEDFSKVRLAKMIADTKSLTPLFYEKEKSRDPNQTILSKFFKGGRVILCGSNSPAGLASRPIKILLCDEVDRYVPTKEGDAVDLAAKRTSNFFDSRIGLFSTPTTRGASRIDVEYEFGTQEEWRHQCPNCQEWHCLDYRQMICDAITKKDSAGNKTVIVNSVKWRCPDCGFEFDEKQMRNSAQMYVMSNPDALKNGVRSFFINGFASPWLKWKNIMREWLEAKGDPTREAVVMNTRFGLSYEYKAEIENISELSNRVEEYDGEIPSGALILTAGVDVQGNRLEYGIYGWNANEGWAICHGIIPGAANVSDTWRGLDRVLSREFRFADGRSLKVARTFIDSGYSTEHVYDYVRGRREMFAIKGRAAYGAPLIQNMSTPRGSGILLMTLNVIAGKDEIYSRLNRGNIHFGNERWRGFDENFFNQLAAERRVLRRSGGVSFFSYEKIRKDARNEALDILVYAFAALKSFLLNADEKTFWENQLGTETKKPPARKIIQRRFNIYG